MTGLVSQPSGPRGPIKAPSRLYEIFLSFIPLDLLEKIASETTRYAREDWVTSDGPRKKKQRCSSTHPQRRHRVNDSDWIPVDKYLLCAVISALLYSGCKRWRFAYQGWERNYDNYQPQVANFLKRTAFEQVPSPLIIPVTVTIACHNCSYRLPLVLRGETVPHQHGSVQRLGSRDHVN